MSALQQEISEAVARALEAPMREIQRLARLIDGMAKAEQPEWVTPKQAAQILKVSERTIRTRIQEGRFDTRRVGARILIRYADLIKSQG